MRLGGSTEAYCNADAFDDRENNLMYVRYDGKAESTGGPKRLTPSQQAVIRLKAFQLLRAAMPAGSSVADAPSASLSGRRPFQQ